MQLLPTPDSGSAARNPNKRRRTEEYTFGDNEIYDDGQDDDVDTLQDEDEVGSQAELRRDITIGRRKHKAGAVVVSAGPRPADPPPGADRPQSRRDPSGSAARSGGLPAVV